MADNEELEVRLNPPPFQYDRHFVMVDPERWDAVARENQELREAVAKLEAEVQRLRDELAREKCAARLRVSKFADGVLSRAQRCYSTGLRGCNGR